MLVGALRGLVGRTRFELSPTGAKIERRLIVRTTSSEVPLGDIVDIDDNGHGKVFLQSQTNSELIADLPGEDEAGTLTTRLRAHLASLR